MQFQVKYYKAKKKKNYKAFCWNWLLSLKSLSHVQFFVTPSTAAHQTPLSYAISWSLLKFMSIESMIPSNHLILCCLLFFLPSIFPSLRVFSSESALHIRWSKYWSFSFSISSSNEYSELISFRMNWFDFLAIQGTLKSLLQHHSSKASILQHSAFFMVQLSQLWSWKANGKIYMEIQRMWNSQSDDRKNIILLTVTEILEGEKKDKPWEIYHATSSFFLKVT